MTRRVFLSWSSGKDSAHALAVLRDDPDVEVLGLLTTVTAPFDRVSMHGVRRELLEIQADRAGLPLTIVEIPSPCTNEEYEQRMRDAFPSLIEAGATGVAFGDLFLEDVRDYRIQLLEGSGLEPVFPLWGLETRALAKTMQTGIRAVLTCVDSKVLSPETAGAAWDAKLIESFPDGIDPCGENGEFHTFVHDAPVFSAPIEVEVGEIVDRGGFVFADVTAGQ